MQGPYLVVRPSGAKSRADRYSSAVGRESTRSLPLPKVDLTPPRRAPLPLAKVVTRALKRKRKSGLYRPQLSTWPSWKIPPNKKAPPRNKSMEPIDEHFAAIINHDDLANGRRLRPPHIPPPRATGRGVDGLSPPRGPPLNNKKTRPAQAERGSGHKANWASPMTHATQRFRGLRNSARACCGCAASSPAPAQSSGPGRRWSVRQDSPSLAPCVQPARNLLREND